MDVPGRFNGGRDCARARESISAGLDGELDELELHRLQAHLRLCADCSAWSEHVESTTFLLREAPFARLSAAIELPGGRRRWRATSALAVAPVLALAASIVVSLGGATHGALGPRARTTTPQRRPDGHGPAVGVYVPDAQHRVFHAV